MERSPNKMITILEALSWLKQFEPSHLQRTTQALVRHITDLQTAESKRKQMINSAIKNSRSQSDKLELPELLLQIAEVKDRQQNHASALDYAKAAVQIYPDGSHQLAVARWILGTIAWKLSDSKLGYSSWYYARDIFSDLADLASQLGETDKLEWYQGLLERINVEMVCTPEETYTWLDIFEPSHLSRAAQQMNNTILDRLESHQYQDVYKLLEQLQNLGKNSTDHIEEAEILVESALAMYRMGNLKEAIDQLQRALGRFEPDSHQQAVTRWLLGIFLWEKPEKSSQAIIQWEKSLEQFDGLARKSDLQNRQNRLKWYHTQRNTMAAAINEKIKEKL
jgi:tetratricopeptide (TPR) repeat protein